MIKPISLAALLLVGAGSAWAGHGQSYRFNVAVSGYGPERINLERVLERQHGIDLDHFVLKSITLRARRTHGSVHGRHHGHARLTIDSYDSPYIRIGRHLDTYRVPAPIRTGDHWRLRIGSGVYVSSIAVDVVPRSRYARRYRHARWHVAAHARHDVGYHRSGYHRGYHRRHHHNHLTWHGSRRVDRYVDRQLRHARHRVRHLRHDPAYHGDRHRDSHRYDSRRDRHEDRHHDRDRDHDRHRDNDHRGGHDDRRRGDDRQRDGRGHGQHRDDDRLSHTMAATPQKSHKGLNKYAASKSPRNHLVRP